MKKACVCPGMCCLVLLCLIYSCNSDKKEETPPGDNSLIIHPVPLTPTVSGFNFPEDSTTIYQWLSGYDTASILQHAWGIWAGLTAPTTQVLGKDTLLVYQTWRGVKGLAQQDSLLPSAGETSNLSQQRGRTVLSVPDQFFHVQLLTGNLEAAAISFDSSFRIFESVAYSPDAARFALSQNLFLKPTFEKYRVPNGIGRIPVFPSASVLTKPTYFVGKPDSSGLIRMPAWPGTPDPAKAYPWATWNNYVFIDIHNQQPAGKKIVTAPNNPTDAQVTGATCNLNDFIHYTLTAEEAFYMNEHQDKGSSQFRAGDLVILVAMHVTTKEISNWTWQTYYWAPDPANPLLPSSTFAASQRPAAITGAPAHYAVSAAYAMVWPNQPITGGTNTGVTPIIAFNPYLEAPFIPAFFGQPNQLNPAFRYGVQTNCMSCHAMASYPNNNYTTDQYIDMGDTAIFNNTVQADFAWSIINNLDSSALLRLKRNIKMPR